jgi:DNA-binding NtrC family response regulator
VALILVIDDERTFRVVAQEALTTAGYEVSVAPTGTAGLKLWNSLGPEVVILDRSLPDMDGLDILRQQRSGKERGLRDCHVIMVTAYADVASAVEALKLGAYDYLTKPLQLADLINSVQNALEALRLRGQIDAVQTREAASVKELQPGESAAMRRVLELVEKVAQSPATTVLLTGESGTGKQLIAELLHAGTPRGGKAAPFVELNCAAMPEALLESELFGHERGAFTDAKEAKRGLIELADEGTLFLDEVAELPAATQAKLLKVLDSMTFRRVGGTRDRRVNLRIVAATNRNLEADVQEGRFRLDLFHRLAVFRIDVPPLRERREDILPLARYFLQGLNRRLGRALSGFTPEALAALQRYEFPGNVRELKNIVERAVVLETGREVQIGSLLLGARPRASSEHPLETFFAEGTTPPTLEQLERLYMGRVMAFAGGNRTQMARVLGVSYPTVQKKIRDYGLS